ncbi:MAG: ABC transporter permease [Lentimicrobiaceae bacterium]|nr:ABC transporter permease [Lentimicrobiaceae bacterium]
MNFEFFISSRIRSKKDASFSRPIILISIAGISLGIMVMLISIAVLKGFQFQIRDKVSGFGGHIQISGFSSNLSLDPQPINLEEINISEIKQLSNVKAVEPFGLKAGILKTSEQIHGVILKGVDSSFRWTFFEEKLTSGKLPVIRGNGPSNEILISNKIAQLLHLATGDDLRMYFITENATRGRKFTISGIYSTGLAEFDESYVLGDIGHIRKLNSWSPNQVSGVEILISDFSKLDETASEVYHLIGYELNAQTIKQLYPQIFDWVEIQDVNVVIILILMVLVSGITIISTLLILILEHTRNIGLLKALGASNASIRRIFIMASLYIALYGLLWGNLLGLGLIGIQSITGFIPLPEESYFMSSVPVSIGWLEIVAVNAGVIAISTLLMLIPSMIVRFISPVKALRFE